MLFRSPTGENYSFNCQCQLVVSNDMLMVPRGTLPDEAYGPTSIFYRDERGSVARLNGYARYGALVGRDRSVYLGGITPQPIDYAAVKAGVLGFTRDLAAYVGDDNIRVNAISPGGFLRKQPKEFIDAYSKKCVLGRMGHERKDLKGAVVYLASEASAYVTGHNLVVDGGFTVWQ